MSQEIATKYPTPAHVCRNAEVIKRLTPVAIELARGAIAGITVSDIRLEGFRRHILTGRESGRDLSYLSAVPAAAGLYATGKYRRSRLAISHGNLQMVWTHQSHSPYATN